MGSKHVLVLPFPAQGHVNPLMHLSRKIVKHGFKITFVNTDFNHKRVVSALSDEKDSVIGSKINLVSIPDGLGSEDDRNELGKFCEAILLAMPARLEELIKRINASCGDDDNKITCIVADVSMAWAFEVANKMGIKGAAFLPASAASLAFNYRIPRLIDDGIIDSNGFPTKRQVIQLLPGMPAMDTTIIPWSCIGDSTAQKIMFDYIVGYMRVVKLTDWWLCNTAYELEPAALSSVPKLLPIGPLMESDQTGNSGGQFWPEDSSCLNWLDQQPPCSVIFVAFGSFTVFDPIQFQELALGLDLTNRSFLWVVRPAGITNGSKSAYPNEFKGTCGKIVDWVPQPKVLSHPAIACFISHCGWNSTLEGLCNGVPFLCWPYFADQLLDTCYICDVWKVGLRFDKDENGIISRGEVKKRVEQLLGDENIRARSLELKEMVMKNITECGQSSNNFNNFIKWMKE